MKSTALGTLCCVFALCLSSCARLRSGPAGAAAPDPYGRRPAASQKFDWPEGKRVAVSLTFDDARLSQADVGIPILDSYGLRATFYVTTSRLEERLAAWKEAVANGHEIGNHSMRHPCTGNFPWARGKALEDYTLAEMAAELAEADVEIERLLGVRPMSFAYPCGQKYIGRGQDVHSYVPLVARRFLTGHGWRDEGANDPSFCDLAQLMAMELDGLSFEQLKVLIDNAAAQGAWLVLAGHEIGSSGRQTVRVDTLRAFCEYAQDPENGLWVDTVANVARYVVEQRAAE